MVERHLVEINTIWYDGSKLHLLQFVGACDSKIEHVGLVEGRHIDILSVLVESHAVAIEQVHIEASTL